MALKIHKYDEEDSKRKSVSPDKKEENGGEQFLASVKCLKLLVVDDNEASAQTMAWSMEMAGHDVKMANSGAEAVEIAKSYLPHVVLLDIGMPGMSGYEVCQRLKQIPELKNTSFIAQTGWEQDKYRQMSQEAGFDHYLVKPVDFQALEKLLLRIQG